MVKVFPKAECDADFPDDMVEEDGDIVFYPGRNAAEAICELLRRVGLNPSEPEHRFEHGWDFDLTYKKRRIWIQVQTFEDQRFHIDTEDTGAMSRFLPSAKRAHGEFLTVLNQELRTDGRFSNIAWFADKDWHNTTPFPVPFQEE
jgi:hypothetical protein